MADPQIVENPTDMDWAELHALIHQAYAYMDGVIDPPSSLHRMSVADFAQKARDETLIVAKLDGQLTGCLFCRREQDWIYVGKVAVSPDHQGKGICKALFAHAFNLAKSQGCKGLELETRIELVKNHRTFEKLGFAKVGDNAHEGYDRPTSIRMRATI